MLGNSSAGLLEAPFLKLPVINVGNRQKQRQHAENIIFVDHNKESIKTMINKALFDAEFKRKCEMCTNPYGDGFTGERVVKVLEQQPINSDLLNKQITY
jgi:GDP/UDP-N,N'-diacetylbacillosamine 2-epimerase (hydrolysing)